MRNEDVLILAGSLAGQSVSRVAGEVMFRGLTACGVSTRLMTIEELNLPFFNPDVHYDDPSVAQTYLNAVRRAQVIIWSSPSYHRTISGSFKNAIDFLELLLNDDPPYLHGKVVGAIATSKGVVASANTTVELAMAAQALHAFTFPLLIPITASHSALDKQGNITDKRICGKLDLLVEEIRTYLRTGLSGSAEVKEAS
jgi:FMN reductase